MKTWFFSFAWWSFILIIDSLNFRRRKNSPLFDSVNNFLFMAFISVFVWLIFELFNLRLRNWFYHDLPHSYWERWLGFFIAFATVIPAMYELSLLIGSFFREKKITLFKIRVTSSLLKTSIFIGVVSVILILVWPRIFFPLVWLCFIFLLEPLNYWLKNRSFLRDLTEEKWNNILSWLLAGFIAGLLWELWNFWAGSHWQYSFSYLNFWRVFQMPVFGYGGFLFFALEIFALYQFLSVLYKKIQRRVILKRFIFVFLLLFYAACFYLIDTFSLQQ